MKTLILLCVFIGAAFAQEIEYYKTANDYLDMNAVVEDPQQLQEYVDCFLERQPCAEVPASYLAVIPDAIQKACTKCNPAQKHLANTFLTGLRKKMPKEYDNFFKKFDPEGIYMDSLLESIKGY
ncbi:allergen Tha p 1-like [Zerene cesonia]|uniref:allergen Tha p 1-like n=1 Tax=Zerene cesonia TaxID=33412 RepID=UPI0018E50C62|nr:allergen Tha p 1-like [Zerene cesonia]